MHYYLMLGTAILIEVFASSMLEYSDGFTKVGPSVFCVCLYGICCFCLARALLGIDLGVAYATWCSVGIVLTSVIAYFLFSQKLTPVGMVGIILIIVGCVLVNLFGSAK